MPKHVYATPEEAKQAKRERDRERARRRRAAAKEAPPDETPAKETPADAPAPRLPVRETLLSWARMQVAGGAALHDVCAYGGLNDGEKEALMEWRRERR